MRFQSGRKLGPLNNRGCGSNHLPGTQFPDLIWLVVEPTHLKNICQNGIISPRIGVKIPEIFELPPPSDFTSPKTVELFLWFFISHLTQSPALETSEKTCRLRHPERPFSSLMR